MKGCKSWTDSSAIISAELWGESLAKYNVPAHWCAEFDAYDSIYPIVCLPVDQIRNNTAIMNLNLRIVENEDYEYAGCMVFAERNTIMFKINEMGDLIRNMDREA